MTSTSPPHPAARRLAVGLAGFCTFVNLYAPQAILPMLSADFGVGPAEISWIMTASALAVALTAPVTGAVADVLGRKRVITSAMLAITIPTLALALAPSIDALIVCRFVQGLMLPPIFAVTIAYVNEEWPPAEAAGATGVYMSGASFGGFSGRFFGGIVADLAGWRWAFVAIAALTLAGALLVMTWLPREKGFVRSEGLAASARQMLVHLRNPQLLATFAVGFGVLFNFIATFTYISFHLAAPPYSLSASALGTIFAVYLIGTLITPWVGFGIARIGRRNLMLATIALWAVGVVLTLAPWLWAIILGLAACAACGLLCQTISTGYVAITATAARSTAVGLYVTGYYIGGGLGAALGGVAWTLGHWPACAALLAVVLAAMALIVLLAWPQAPAAARAGSSRA